MNESSAPEKGPEGLEAGETGAEKGLTRVMPRKLSEEINGLIAAFADREVCLGEVLVVLKARAYTLLLILLALPFCTPIPLPGVSTPFGLVIAFIGFRLFLGQKPWLPERLLMKKLPPKFFARLLGGNTNVLVAVGTGGGIPYSRNIMTNIVGVDPAGQPVKNEVSLFGLDWRSANSPVTTDLQGMAANASQFIITGAGGTVLASGNGVDWSTRNSGVTNYLSSITAWPGASWRWAITEL